MKPLTVHHVPEVYPDIRVPDAHQDIFSKTTLGFWIYLMNDCILFATLFATYAVLHHNTFGGPGSRELFSLPTVFIETMVLLFSSVTCGFALLSAVRVQINQVVYWLALSLLLGATFVAIELHEFAELLHNGHDWTKSAFLSSFFTLVGTHGLHVSVGLFWMAVMIGQLLLCGLTAETFRRLIVFSLFWHFLDLVWIFIFTFVYLMGVA